MLKNNDQRREFILNKDNWIVKDSLSTLGIRALELKLTNSISLIKFEKKLTQEEKNCTHNQYHYVDDVKVGDYVKFDMGNDFYKLVDGCITKPSLSISNAIALIKILKEEK